MKKNLTYIVYSFLFLLVYSCQENESQNQTSSLRGGSRFDVQLERFESEINNFEAMDSAELPPQNAILFTGSSSIRMWETLKEDMQPMPIINRGFGGSTIPEVIHYAEKIVFPYQPKIIVFYCGENDIHEKTLPEMVFKNFKNFVGMVEDKLPNTHILYISMKPSLNRWEEWRAFQKGNGMVQTFAEGREKLHYLDVSPTMIAENGNPDPSIFIEDGLHMNRAGYKRWTELIKPVLTELYQEEM